jgi:hypothetical protein
VAAQIAAGHLKAGDLGHVLAMHAVTEDDLRAFGDVSRLLANINTPADYARVQ